MKLKRSIGPWTAIALSAVWDQAANRLPTEQAVLCALTSGDWAV
jgi:hypothetical protein